MKMRFICAALAAFSLFSCKKNEGTGSNGVPSAVLNFKFHFDPTLDRLNSRGEIATVPVVHAAQNITFNSVSPHYIELCPDENTQLGEGVVLYLGAETSSGGDMAIDFRRSLIAGDGEVFFNYNLQSVPAGTYKYLRVGIAYQKFDVKMLAGTGDIVNATVASFLGRQNYIDSYVLRNEVMEVNHNEPQGYYGFEYTLPGSSGYSTGYLSPSDITFPNPIYSTSPIPTGSCVVTGEFAEPFVVTNEEGRDRTIQINVSANKSFEWEEHTGDGLWEPSNMEEVMDLGIRGIVPVEE